MNDLKDKSKPVSRALHLLTITLLSVALSSLHGSQAFLFHQLQPVSSSALSYSNFPDSNNSSSLQYNQQSSYPNRGNPNDQYQTISYPSSRDPAAQSQVSKLDESTRSSGCPSECHCSAQIADCSNRNLHKVPIGFPQDIKRIRLERNNITELGAYSFQGLKRLQRIDLSNNNLNRIDPLAFAGGLQSLNSLILYSNKINQLPANVFSELSQLQLLLLNANALQCIHRDLFQPLANLNLLSLFDNNIETLTNGTFDGLKNIRTIHLGKNPLICDCNLRWLADYLESNPVETSEARCEGPARDQGKKLSQLSKQRFKCEGKEQHRTSQIANQCNDQSCPAGCICNGSSIDCSRVSESRAGSGIYELPDVPDDVPVYVTRMRINDSRIKRIRQTGLFRRLANSQKLDLGNNKIIDIEDNAINGAGGSTGKPERIVFVLLENDHCDAHSSRPKQPEDACSMAPRVNPPNFDNPCYNGGSCVASARPSLAALNYTCLCPAGFAGPLCEINIDDCVDHQCQNGAICVDGINSYKCTCRDPTTSGEFCEQLSSFSTSSANSIAPIALPIIAAASQQQQSNLNLGMIGELATGQLHHQQDSQAAQQLSSFVSHPPQILARSADISKAQIDLSGSKQCKRVTQKKVLEDGNGCQSAKPVKLAECLGTCDLSEAPSCCIPARVKRRRIRMLCNDGASYVKSVDLIKKCSCSTECSQNANIINQQQVFNQSNVSQGDQLLQITRIDAIDS